VSRGTRLAYLCLQATRQGQASYAHVHEIIAGLETRGFDATLFQPSYSEDHAAAPGAVGRALSFRRVQATLRSARPLPEALYIRAHFAAAPTARWASRHSIPVIQEVNGPYEDLFTAWPWTRAFRPYFIARMREQYRSADALITVTDRLADWLAAETGRSDVHVVPNGANIEVFRPGAQPLPGLPARYVVLFGALAEWQGVPIILEALGNPMWPADVSLVVAGAGSQQALFSSATDPRVVYLGVVPYSDMPRIIGGALAGLSTQTMGRDHARAGLFSPLKTFETLACGVPAIVTDSPGQSELIRQHHAGIVIPPGDSVALAAAVARLAENPAEAKAMGQRGMLAVVAEHSWDSRAAATARIIRALLARQGGAV